jgi:hypothetical protein
VQRRLRDHEIDAARLQGNLVQLRFRSREASFRVRGVRRPVVGQPRGHDHDAMVRTEGARHGVAARGENVPGPRAERLLGPPEPLGDQAAPPFLVPRATDGRPLRPPQDLAKGAQRPSPRLGQEQVDAPASGEPPLLLAAEKPAPAPHERGAAVRAAPSHPLLGLRRA